jgi:hypothetical protein
MHAVWCEEHEGVEAKARSHMSSETRNGNPKDTMKKTNMIRQGDVLLVRVDDKLPDLEESPKDPRGMVLAEGETSGHFHAVFGNGARLMHRRESGTPVVVADKGGEIRVVGGGAGGVDRHTPISLSPGRYEVRIQRSWTSANASRRVED